MCNIVEVFTPTDVARAGAVLANFSTFYPGGNGYEVAGFFWWQRSKDGKGRLWA
jgi:hypothetical protein